MLARHLRTPFPQPLQRFPSTQLLGEYASQMVSLLTKWNKTLATLCLGGPRTLGARALQEHSQHGVDLALVVHFDAQGFACVVLDFAVEVVVFAMFDDRAELTTRVLIPEHVLPHELVLGPIHRRLGMPETRLGRALEHGEPLVKKLPSSHSLGLHIRRKYCYL